MKESKAMKEIYEIREKNYERTKGMSKEEYIKSIRERASRSKLRAMCDRKAAI